MTQVSPLIVGGGIAEVGGVILAIAILSIVVAYGLLKGWSRARTLTVVLSIISIALNAISVAAGNIAGVVSIIISGVILYYLYRPYVKTYFGKSAGSFGILPLKEPGRRDNKNYSGIDHRMQCIAK